MSLLKSVVGVSMVQFAATAALIYVSSTTHAQPEKQILANQNTVQPSSTLNQPENKTATANQLAATDSPAPTQSELAPTQTATPTQTAVNTPTPQSAAPAAGCLVVIDGVAYDLDTFRKIHSGGDIFQCNTDMSAIFHQQHSSDYLSKLSQYRIQ